jgi:ribonuclease-3
LIDRSGTVSPDRKKILQAFQRSLGIKVSVSLLDIALTHRSTIEEDGTHATNNERLEFLGDSVLGLVAASRLYEKVEREEGELARIKSVVVSEDTLSSLAIRLGVDRILRMGKGEELSGGRTKKAILADALEAVIGAIYKDSGFDAASRFVSGLIVPEIDLVLQDRHKKDYKTLLQEYSQKKYRGYPSYQLVKQTGPDHERVFWIKCTVQGRSFGPCSGRSKKEAEQAAAQLAWESLGAQVDE